MPTAKKQASGSWRVRVYSHTENGKCVYKTFSSKDPTNRGKFKCEQEAMAWLSERENRKRQLKTFREALDEYIDARRNTLSPRTLEDYERSRDRYMTELNDLIVDDITQNDIQRLIDIHSAKLSPKTVANIHCLISAVMRQERPNMALATTLPQKTKTNMYIPSDKEIKALLCAVEGTAMELPVMLACFGPMRAGEICALRKENISGCTVHVCENMVKKTIDHHATWIIRHPKSTESDRYITYPDIVAKLWKKKKDRVVEMNPNTLTKAFRRVLDENKIHHFRFHDLRHYSASIQHAMGIPDAYIMARGGWSSDRILKEVYRHTLSDQQKEMTNRTNSHFETLYRTKFTC